MGHNQLSTPYSLLKSVTQIHACHRASTGVLQIERTNKISSLIKIHKYTYPFPVPIAIHTDITCDTISGNWSFPNCVIITFILYSGSNCSRSYFSVVFENFN